MTSSGTASDGKDRFKKTLTAVFLLFWFVLAIDPVDRGIWVLENILVVTLFPLALWLDKQYRFSNTTFLCMTAFVTLHLFGAHFTYNTMAWFDWLSDWLGYTRNYYDQFIHFLFGLMMFFVFFEVFFHQGLTRRFSYMMAFLFITAIGCWYEILEWFTMELFCYLPEDACARSITQDDVWDAQKDMFYAILGAVVSMLLHRVLRRHPGQ